MSRQVRIKRQRDSKFDTRKCTESHREHVSDYSSAYLLCADTKDRTSNGLFAKLPVKDSETKILLRCRHGIFAESFADRSPDFVKRQLDLDERSSH